MAVSSLQHQLGERVGVHVGRCCERTGEVIRGERYELTVAPFTSLSKPYYERLPAKVSAAAQGRRARKLVTTAGALMTSPRATHERTVCPLMALDRR